MQSRRQIGSTYEEMAEKYLEKIGFQILEKNYRCRLGEIDLIARDGNALVFLEVKYRKTDSFGNPAEAVTFSKQRTICKVANHYRMIHRVPENHNCRFDVVAIQGEKIEVIKNAFEYS